MHFDTFWIQFVLFLKTHACRLIWSSFSCSKTQHHQIHFWGTAVPQFSQWMAHYTHDLFTAMNYHQTAINPPGILLCIHKMAELSSCREYILFYFILLFSSFYIYIVCSKLSLYLLKRIIFQARCFLLSPDVK